MQESTRTNYAYTNTAENLKLTVGVPRSAKVHAFSPCTETYHNNVTFLITMLLCTCNMKKWKCFEES